MAIVKLSSSGKAFQFVLTEEVPAGTVFQCSSKLIAGVVGQASLNGDFVVLTRLPLPISPDRYPKSKIWFDESVARAVESSGEDDAFAERFINERAAQKIEKKVKNFVPKW